MDVGSFNFSGRISAETFAGAEGDLIPEASVALVSRALFSTLFFPQFPRGFGHCGL